VPIHRSRLLLVAALLAATAAFSGCTPATLAGESTRTPPELPGAYCGAQPAPAHLVVETRWLDLDDEHFAVAAVGDPAATTVAVFANQTTRSNCGFWYFAADLATDGIQSQLVNACGSGQSNCTASDDVGASTIRAVLAIATQAKRDGAARVVIIGSSVTGSFMIGAAASPEAPGLVDAVADLSGPVIAGGIDCVAVAPQITVPTFLASDPTDGAVTPAQLLSLFAALGNQHSVIVTTANGHGSAMLRDDTGQSTTVAAQLAAFIENVG
jgi:dienelactone hydrolase